jgi:hypothetical protein
MAFFPGRNIKRRIRKKVAELNDKIELLTRKMDESPLSERFYIHIERSRLVFLRSELEILLKGV